MKEEVLNTSAKDLHYSKEILGANETEYSQVMSEEEEESEFIWAASKIALITKTLENLPSLERVADIGCRTGRLAAYYQAQLQINEMYGFDISPVPLSVAQQKGIITRVWIAGVSDCPVSDNFFDAIIAGDLIEHLMNTDIFLQELHRVLRSGGYLIITTPNLAWWWNRMRLFFGKVPANIGSVSPFTTLDPSVDIKHLRVSVNSEWLHLFAQHNFRCISVTPYNYPKLLRGVFKVLDNKLFTRFPNFAHSNLFLLEKAL